jgi:pleiotropic regulator 1
LCDRATAVSNSSGSRLLTGEADKTIKVWKEDTDATPQSHPVNYNPVKEPRRY